MRLYIQLTTFLLLLSCLLIDNHLLAQNNISAKSIAAKKPLTAITFDDMEKDFGTVMAGEKVSEIFTFKNTGDEPLVLSSAKGSCSCTVSAFPKEPILPGETSFLEVSYDTQNKRGLRKQKVTILANTYPIETVVYLKGQVNIDKETLTKEKVGNLSEIEQEAIHIQSRNCVAVYPNPTADILKLNFSNDLNEAAIVRIFSNSGKLMAEKKLVSTFETIEFEVHHYPEGTYIANVQVAGQQPEAHCFVVTR